MELTPCTLLLILAGQRRLAALDHRIALWSGKNKKETPKQQSTT
jgi:hypothetical protein